MPTAVLFTFISVILVSLLSFTGLFFLSVKIEKLKKITVLLVSLSTGTLLGGSFFHLLPEAIEKNGSKISIWMTLLAGVLIFFILEKIIFWRHCHVPTTKDHPHPLGIMNLVGDGLHNFIDGIIIAGSYMIDIKLGLASTIGVLFHEIPQEIGDFGVLLYAGYSKTKALTLNFIIALSSVAGAIIMIMLKLSSESLTSYIIPFTAGGFIYIATADLMPELKKETKISRSLMQLLMIFIGIGAMYLLKYY